MNKCYQRAWRHEIFTDEKRSMQAKPSTCWCSGKSTCHRSNEMPGKLDIASVPHAAPQQAKKKPKLGNRLRWLDGWLKCKQVDWETRREKDCRCQPNGTDGDEQKAKIVAKHAPRKMLIEWDPMKILVFVLLAYTAVMLLIHVSTGKLLKEWDGPAESWIKSQFPPQRVLRVEALYWSFSLAIWTLLAITRLEGCSGCICSHPSGCLDGE